METTIVNATTEFLQTQIVAKDARIAQLEAAHARVSEMSNTNYKAAQTLIDSMREWTLNALEEREISETNAEEIADICGFELTKEFEVEVTVTYSMTVNARTAEDAEYAVHDIDFDTVSYNDESISYLSSSVDSVDI
jgi:outer membrane PBP1 activator LpoA protein